MGFLMGVIRLLLALSVIFSHSQPLPLTNNALIGGMAAVQSFFIISGFYIALVINEKYRTDLPAFYFNRALRLYPSYLLVLGFVTATQLATSGTTWLHAIIASDVLSDGSRALLILASTTLFGSDAMMFFYPGSDGLSFTPNFWLNPVQLWKYHPIPQAWSLPIELAFYAVAPFIVRRPVVLLLIAIASYFARQKFYVSFSSGDPWSYRFVPFEMFFFCLGALAYFVYRVVGRHPLAPRIGALAVLLLLAMMFGAEHLTRLQADYWIFYWTLFASIPFVFAATRYNSIDGYIGELSYPVYVVHMAAVAAVGIFPTSNPLIGFQTAYSEHLPRLGGYGVAIYSIAAAALVNAAFQHPLERWLKRKP